MSPGGGSSAEGPQHQAAPQCWEGQYPKLAQLATRLLSVPATAAHILRMCRVGGKVANPADFRLNGVTFENLMFIKCNQGLR
ncbi:hypothetical protein HPB49_012992 [Dermacentor silvarum]|uniref:Uncharacterized protein n=1 Tax=Dermacentor silvarum TaxID=543639 RepID=A0ACB8C9I8_DERSI|nr:hypothetical protein HPB49_012992 [Dermacentor silvarum]